jgi:hypothetical protein
MVSKNSTKRISRGPGLVVIGVTFNIISRVLKTSKACVTRSIMVTFVPTPISSITYGTRLRVTSISISSMGKNKVQETMANFTLQIALVP